jgi:hypothetical protein
MDVPIGLLGTATPARLWACVVVGHLHPDRRNRPGPVNGPSSAGGRLWPGRPALGWRCGRWTVVRRLRPGNVLDPEAPSWRWPAWPQRFRGSRRRGVGPAQRSGRRLAIGLPVGERSSARPTQACGPCLLVVVIPRRTSFTVGPTTSVTFTRHRRRALGQRPHCSRSQHSPTPRSSRLHRAPLL